MLIASNRYMSRTKEYVTVFQMFCSKTKYCSHISCFFGMCRVQYKGHTCSGEVSNTTLKLCNVFCFFSSVVQTCGTTKSTFQCISIHLHILVLFFIFFSSEIRLKYFISQRFYFFYF